MLAAITLAKFGKVYEGIEALQSAIETDENIPKSHAFRLDSQNLLAEAHMEGGQTSKAIKLLSHIIGMEGLSEDNPGLVRSQSLLAHALEANGQILEARELRQRIDKIKGQQLMSRD